MEDEYRTEMSRMVGILSFFLTALDLMRFNFILNMFLLVKRVGLSITQLFECDACFMYVWPLV